MKGDNKVPNAGRDMRITVERYAIRNPKWQKPSERFRVLSKRLCCDSMRGVERHLRMENRWPPKLIFWLEAVTEDENDESFEMWFCPGCGEKVEFVEQEKAA